MSGFYGVPGNRTAARRQLILNQIVELTIKLKFGSAMPILRDKAKCIIFHVGKKAAFQRDKCAILSGSEV